MKILRSILDLDLQILRSILDLDLQILRSILDLYLQILRSIIDLRINLIFDSISRMLIALRRNSSKIEMKVSIMEIEIKLSESRVSNTKFSSSA